MRRYGYCQGYWGYWEYGYFTSATTFKVWRFFALI